MTRELAAPRVDSPRGLATLILATLAAFTLQVVRSDASGQSGWAVTPTLFAAGAAVWLWFAQSVSPSWQTRCERWLPQILLAFGLGTLAVAGILRLTGWYGEPFELVLLVLVQNVALGLASLAHRRRCRGTATLLSAFIVLFATAMTTNRVAFVAAACYAIAGLWWLMGSYWDRLEGTFAAASSQRCVPARTAALLVTFSAVLATAALVGATGTTTYVLKGFMPSSGGDRWHDPHARAGVGDGDHLVAAKDEALSFGPVESELFLESEMPSLYDVADDTYGEPPRPNKRLERTIALDMRNVGEEKEHVAQAQRSGREFSAVRRRVARRGETPSDRAAPALLYVVGRTPQHLALETHDVFDGREWSHSGTLGDTPSCHLQTLGARPWIRVRQPGSLSMFRGESTMALKIINLKTNRVPSPPHLAAVHIDRIDRPDFFAWTDDGVLSLPDREHIPQLTVIHLQSLDVNLEPLHSSGDFTTRITRLASRTDSADAPARSQSDAIAECLRLHDPGGVIRESATRWTRGVPRGWEQVEAVVARLREEFVHDGTAVVPADCEDAAAYFLNAGRGPDYLFATTAAMLLRSLGYPTRLVSGFYVRPERFDRRAKQTAVLKEDVHVWVEVGIDGRHWMAVEPTPGFDPPRESLTWRQQVERWLRVAVRGARDRWLAILAAVSVAVLAVWQRRRWLDALLWVCWWLGGRGSMERQVFCTLRLLEWRAWLAGRPRPAHVTLTRWYAPLLANSNQETRFAAEAFFSAANLALYAPRETRQETPAWQPKEVRRSCRFVADTFPARRMLAEFGETSHGEPQEGPRGSAFTARLGRQQFETTI